jgi:hypothetical protein
MSVRAALAAAARDLYGQSWRLLAVNTALSTVVLALLAAAAFAPPLLVLLPLAGPFGAALAHCAVLVGRGGDATLREAAAGLRQHARRGLALGLAATLVLALGRHALAFYASHGAWIPAALAAELLALLALHQLFLWTLAVAAPRRPLRGLAAEAAFLLVRRPGQALALGLALLALNAAAAAAGVLPLLMLGGAYSFLAAAHLVAEGPAAEEPAWQA